MRSRLLLALIFIGVSFPLVIFSQDRESGEYFLSFDDDENAGFRLNECSKERPACERPACSIIDLSTRDAAAAAADDDDDDDDDDDELAEKFARLKGLSESESAYFSSEEEGNVTLKCGNLRCACALQKRRIDGSLVYYLVDEDVTYQQATINNFDQILSLCQMIRGDSKDSKKLLMRPGDHLNQWVRDELRSGHFYIAINQGGEIISFVRFFVVPDRRKSKDILQQELKCIGAGRQFLGLRSHVVILEHEELCGKKVKVPTLGKSVSKIRAREFESNCDQIVMYFGTHYTDPRQRGKGYGSGVLDFATKCQFQKILDRIDYDARSVELVIAYGEVAFNPHSAILRMAGELAGDISKHISDADNGPHMSKATLFKYTYRAHMPQWYVDEYDKLQQREVDSADWNDTGNLVVYFMTGGFKQCGGPGRSPRGVRRFKPVEVESVDDPEEGCL